MPEQQHISPNNPGRAGLFTFQQTIGSSTAAEETTLSTGQKPMLNAALNAHHVLKPKAKKRKRKDAGSKKESRKKKSNVATTTVNAAYLNHDQIVASNSRNQQLDC